MVIHGHEITVNSDNGATHKYLLGMIIYELGVIPIMSWTQSAKVRETPNKFGT